MGFEQISCSLGNEVGGALRMAAGNVRLVKELCISSVDMEESRKQRTTTERSTIRSPSVPFTVRSGFTTPSFDACGAMDAVEVGWEHSSRVLARVCIESCVAVTPELANNARNVIIPSWS